jgi:hypothetical protein
MRGYHLFANDGEIGHVDDFLIDEDWTVRYLVVDTSNFIGGKAVLISSADIVNIDSPEKKIHVNLSREQIKHAPPVEEADIELIETLPPTII